MLCDKCGKTVNAGDAFCRGCGDRVVATMLCKKCGKTVSAGDAFCRGCGDRATAATQSIAASTPKAMILAPGRIFLLVTGIMYIIVGVACIIMGLLFFLADAVVLADLVEDAMGFDFAVYLLVAGGYSFVIGVLGVLHRNSYDKAGLLVILGTIALIGELVGPLIWGTFSSMTILILAIPICYILGAHKNKSMNL